MSQQYSEENLRFLAEAADAAYRSGDAIPEAVDFNPDSPVTELFTKNAGASLQGTGVSRGQYGEHWYHAPAPIRLSPERSPSPIYLGESAATFGHTAAFHFETAGAAPQTGVDTNQTPVQRGPNMSPVRSVKAGASQFGAVVNPLLSGVPGLDSGGPFALQVQTAIQTACNKYAESARVQAAIQGCNLAAILAAVAAEEDLNKDPSRVKRAARAKQRRHYRAHMANLHGQVARNPCARCWVTGREHECKVYKAGEKCGKCIFGSQPCTLQGAFFDV